jgi:hypothetical protein
MSQVIFVYAVDGGLFNTLTHYVHKVVSPKTYPCNLCALTNDMLGMKREWAQFIRELGVKTEFLHRNEFIERYPAAKQSFPSVFISTGGAEPKELVTSTELNACHDLAGLISLVGERVKLLTTQSGEIESEQVGNTGAKKTLLRDA